MRVNAEVTFPKPQVTFHGDVNFDVTVSQEAYDKLVEMIEAQNYGKRNNKVVYKLQVYSENDPARALIFSNLIPYPEYQL